MPPKHKIVIGIDFGTTYSGVAWVSIYVIFILEAKIDTHVSYQPWAFELY